MPCLKPIPAWHHWKHGVTFSPQGKDPTNIELPCGSCISCRLQHASERSIRCIHESQMFENNIFVTLTFDNEHLPHDLNIDWEIFKKFFKRLRTKHVPKNPYPVEQEELRKQWQLENGIRYFACGEYGGEFKNENNMWLWDRSKYRHPKPTFPRVHFHAIIFNYRPSDEEIFYQNKHGQIVYTSEELNNLWGNGHTSHGEVTAESCGYVARYVTKKQNDNPMHDFKPKYGQDIYDLHTGELICKHPTQPEIAFGSSQPAIGAAWLQKYWKTDCFNQGFVLGPAPDHKKYSIPRYYWKWLERNHPQESIEYCQLKSEKFLQHKEQIEAGNTYDMQNAKERILIKKTSTLKREL